MESLQTTDEFERAIARPLALIFKHSTTCGISASAYREVQRFLADASEPPVFLVDVHQARALSNYIEEKTGVRHESPQVLVFKEGALRWHDSHGRVTAEALSAQTGESD